MTLPMQCAGINIRVLFTIHLINYAGKIPLRQLVYRVLDLPPSMRPLVYDFGQLNKDTEDNYIKHIVHDHVSYAVILFTLPWA